MTGRVPAWNTFGPWPTSAVIVPTEGAAEQHRCGRVSERQPAQDSPASSLQPSSIGRAGRRARRYTLILRTPQTTLRRGSVRDRRRARVRRVAGSEQTRRRFGTPRPGQFVRNSPGVPRHRSPRPLPAGRYRPPHRVHSGRVHGFHRARLHVLPRRRAVTNRDDGWRLKSVKRTPKARGAQANGAEPFDGRAHRHLDRDGHRGGLRTQPASIRRGRAPRYRPARLDSRLLGKLAAAPCSERRAFGSLTIAGFKALSARARYRDVLERPSRVARGFGCVAHRQARIARSNLSGSPGSHQHQQGALRSPPRELPSPIVPEQARCAFRKTPRFRAIAAARRHAWSWLIPGGVGRPSVDEFRVDREARRVEARMCSCCLKSDTLVVSRDDSAD